MVFQFEGFGLAHAYARFFVQGGGGQASPLGFAKGGPKKFKGGHKKIRNRAAAVTGPHLDLVSSLYNSPRRRQIL